MKKRWILVLCLATFWFGVVAEWQFINHQMKVRKAARAAERQAKDALSGEKMEAMQWAPLPRPPMPAYGQPVAVPSFAPITPGAYAQMVNGIVAPGSDLDQRLFERFQQIVESNPDPEMAELAAKTRAKEIEVHFGMMPPVLLATFQLWPDDDNLVDDGRPYDRYRPRIMINLDFITQVNQADDLRYLEVVLDHEYQHYKQYQETTNETLRRTFLAAMPARGQTRSERVCTFLWQNEYEAYRHSSEKAVSWGVRNDLSVRVGDPRSFAQFVFITAGQNAMMNFPECLPVWAGLAGHPHPEAFKT